ncbi:MAG TPA: hypothetical protein VGO40_02995 [Longimicrobium sp.]|jgi:hypothetical protein|nr:hypothetical protein [Longimicrobium sp.]
MTTLAHPRTDGFGRPGGPRTDGRALLERAVADAPSHVPPPAGWLRRLLPRDRSAAALIRRYRLWPAIEHAYERVAREMGPARVEISAEDSYGTEFVMVVFLCDSLDFERMSDLTLGLSRDCTVGIAERDWHRLVFSVRPGPSAVGE